MTEIIEADFQAETLPAVHQPQALTASMTIFGDITSPEGLARAIATVENGMKLKRHITQLAIATGPAESWIDMEGTPYCTEAECERILAMIGASVTITRKDLEREEDGNYGVEVEVLLQHPLMGAWTGLGYAHTTDPFLGTNHGKSRKTLDQVSRHNLQQHAYTRAKGNLVRKLMGLTGYTWETLYQRFGFERGKGGSVEFLKNQAKPRDTRPTYTEKKRERDSENAEREDRNGPPVAARQETPKDDSLAEYKRELTKAIKAAGVSFPALSKWTQAELSYSGKALEAPPELRDRILSAVKDGEVA